MNLKQRGGGNTIILILAVAGFCGWIFFKLFPIYMETSKVSMALEGLKSQPEVAKKTEGELQSSLIKRLNVDGIGFINQTTWKELVKYERTPNGFKMNVHFEKRAPLVSNLHLLVVFDKTIEAP